MMVLYYAFSLIIWIVVGGGFYILPFNGISDLVRCITAKRIRGNLPKIKFRNKLETSLFLLAVVIGEYWVARKLIPPFSTTLQYYFLPIIGGCLLVYIVCAIICWKMQIRKPWEQFISEGMKTIFAAIVKAREKLKRINDSKGLRIVIGVSLALAVIAACNGLLALSIPFFALMFFTWFLDGMRSCRKLLFFWLILYCVLAFFCNFIIRANIGTDGIIFNLHLILYEILLVTFLTFAWMFTIGVADHDVGKLAALAINTITRIITAVLTVFVACAGDMIYAPLLVQLQTIILYILLPLVVAGTIATFLKECQVYWEKEHLEALLIEIQMKQKVSCMKKALWAKRRILWLKRQMDQLDKNQHEDRDLYKEKRTTVIPDKRERVERKIQRLRKKQKEWDEEIRKIEDVEQKESEETQS